MKPYGEAIFLGFSFSFQQLGVIGENSPIFLFLFILYKSTILKTTLPYNFYILVSFVTFIYFIVISIYPTHTKIIFIPFLLISSILLAKIFISLKDINTFKISLDVFIGFQFVIFFFEGLANFKLLGFSRVTQNIFNFSGTFYEPSYLALFSITILGIKLLFDDYKLLDKYQHILLITIILVSGSFWGFLLLPILYLKVILQNKIFFLIFSLPLIILIIIKLPILGRLLNLINDFSWYNIFQIEQSGMMRFAPFVNAFFLFFQNYGLMVTESNDSLREFMKSIIPNLDPIIVGILNSEKYIIPSILTGLLLVGIYALIPFFMMLHILGFRLFPTCSSLSLLLICFLQLSFQSFFTSPIIFCLWYLLSKRINEKKIVFCKH